MFIALKRHLLCPHSSILRRSTMRCSSFQWRVRRHPRSIAAKIEREIDRVVFNIAFILMKSPIVYTHKYRNIV